MKDLKKDLMRLFFLTIIFIGIFVCTKVFSASPESLPITNIAVKIGNGGGYENGDVIVAMNAKSALFIQAEQLTHPNKMKRKTNGTIEQGELLEDFYEKTREYKFERVSQNEVKRTRRFVSDASTQPISYINTESIDFISDVPNAKGEFMNVPLFIERNKKIVFGSKGQEYWYGGETKITDETMDEVWDELEDKTPKKRNHEFPFSETEKKHFAILKVQNMDDVEVAELTEPLLDAQGKILKKRKYKVDFSKAGLNAEQISSLQDKNKIHNIEEKLDINIIKNEKIN